MCGLAPRAEKYRIFYNLQADIDSLGISLGALRAKSTLSERSEFVLFAIGFSDKGNP